MSDDSSGRRPRDGAGSSDEPGGAERRIRPRSRLHSWLRVGLDGRWHPARCLNLSMSGALVELPRVPVQHAGDLVGSEGLLVLEHECGEDRLVVNASFKVVRIAARQGGAGAALGLHFTHLGSESSIELFNLVRWQAEGESE